VALLTLHAPDEAVARLGERVQLVEPRHEAGHDRSVERALHPADVDLREMHTGHPAIPVEATKTTKTRNPRKRPLLFRLTLDFQKGFVSFVLSCLSWCVALCAPAQPVH